MKFSTVVILGLGLFCATAYGVNQQNQQTTASQTEMKAKKAQDKGAIFLEENKKKPGVVTLADGLQYKIITQGKGPKPTGKSQVKVHYLGTLIDGTEFDSSYKRGEPITFPVNAVIPGWTEALQLMPVGSTWELYIPAKLAYGEFGAPPIIGPNETLIFRVNLINFTN
jgi:FKBP-type peptidyl-prolyl cis-trans isomerase